MQEKEWQKEKTIDEYIGSNKSQEMVEELPGHKILLS